MKKILWKTHTITEISKTKSEYISLRNIEPIGQGYFGLEEGQKDPGPDEKGNIWVSIYSYTEQKKKKEKIVESALPPNL